MNDQLANDRTFLAWLRTGIALFGLGFVVAKIALFVDSSAGGLKSQAVYTAVGVVMVVCGALLILVGYVQHRKVAHILSAAGEDDLPLSRWPRRRMRTQAIEIPAAVASAACGASAACATTELRVRPVVADADVDLERHAQPIHALHLLLERRAELTLEPLRRLEHQLVVHREQ